ncbi:hypothetical protein ACFO25_06690 [Paenactinomyces guangxiensis]|uniref:Secreted protein n=1 Tax=Paenactinomyces guangxiensis TaxID=1490290 RepID=A0A7W2A7L8_9BACL|nr:hypothetical protein [Paenactinomyces guangxiensis]MBA4493262.1 hypothetical protein [Paenactinomyces guangxiensis]MBH8589887.1 hypothetical protein [Paenactinomyces guangxiensis]
MKKILLLVLAFYLSLPLNVFAKDNYELTDKVEMKAIIGDYYLTYNLEKYWSSSCQTSYPYVQLSVSAAAPGDVYVIAQRLIPGDTWRNVGSWNRIKTTDTHKVFTFPKYATNYDTRWRVMVQYSSWSSGSSRGSIICQGSN